MKTQRLVELDALRGIAAVMVVFYHYFERYDLNFGHDVSIPVDWTHYGQYGVHLFFVISGFVIFWTLNKTEKPLDFIVSRFSRLYPVYWVSILVTVFFVTLFELPDRVPTIGQVFVNLTMLQAFVKIKSVDGVYWTLAIELVFYAIMFSIFLIGKLQKITYFLIALVSLSIAGVGVFDILPVIIRHILILDYISLFALGVMLHKSLNNNISTKDIILILLSIINIFVIYELNIAIMIFCILILIFCATHGYLPFLKVRVFSFLGSISYSLYLIHQYVGFSIILEGYSIGLNPYLSIIIAITVSIIIASGLTYYVEKPSLNIIRSIYRKFKTS